MRAPAPPAGYLLVTAGRCSAVTHAAHEQDARTILAEGTPYEVAARDLAARPMMGRGVAYAVTLPVTGVRVVVRHNRHGGLLAPLTRDLFLPPTRAPRELATALQLARLGLPTPEVVMYSLAPGPFAFQRADVMTREVVAGRDLSHYLGMALDAEERALAWEATLALLRSMRAAGVRHHDLNVKNVLLAPGRTGLVAWLLDVDRVVFGEPGSRRVGGGNALRLRRSVLKQAEGGLSKASSRELAALEETAGATG